jgi:hypothetical protein
MDKTLFVHFFAFLSFWSFWKSWTPDPLPFSHKKRPYVTAALKSFAPCAIKQLAPKEILVYYEI